MADFNDANETLMELMFTGLDHGIDSVKDSGGPLVPFLLTEKDGEKKLARFVTDRLEEGPVLARKQLVEQADLADFAVVAYDGYVTIEGTKFDAVMVEGYDKNDAIGYVLAQRYQPKKILSKFKTIGNAAFMGTEENILK